MPRSARTSLVDPPRSEQPRSPVLLEHPTYRRRRPPWSRGRVKPAGPHPFRSPDAPRIRTATTSHADLSETSRTVEASVLNRRQPPAVSCTWSTTSMASTIPSVASHTPVRFEFTDLHHRCAPLAATYCCPADRLLPTVARDRYPLSPGTVLRDSRADAQRTRRRPADRSCGPVADRRVR